LGAVQELHTEPDDAVPSHLCHPVLYLLKVLVVVADALVGGEPSFWEVENCCASSSIA
jgi:hypothetical protein